MPATLACRALDAASFTAFGEVISADGRSWHPANDGRAQRYANLARLDHSGDATQPEVSICRVQASSLPMKVSSLERHAHSSQLFMPVSGGHYLVVVCETDAAGKADPVTLAAFIADRAQGIAYKPGVWHMPIVALDQPADFLMFMWESGTMDDCETQALEQTVTLIANVDP